MKRSPRTTFFLAIVGTVILGATGALLISLISGEDDLHEDSSQRTLAIANTTETPKALGDGRVMVAGQELHIEPEVLNLLLKIAQPEPAEVIPTDGTSCRHTQNVDEALRTPACAQKMGNQRALLQAVHRRSHACRYVQNPISVFQDVPVRDPFQNEVSDLEMAILFYGAPVAAAEDTPNGLVQNSLVSRIGQILLKVRETTYRRYLREQITNLEKLAPLTLDGCGTTAAETRTEILQAIDEQKAALKILKNFEAHPEPNPAHLPVANLNPDERVFASMVLGALSWRTRGGGLYSTPRTRYEDVALAVATIARLNGSDEPDTIGFLQLEQSTRGWSKFMTIGTNGGNRMAEFRGMQDRGRYQMETMISYLEKRGYDVSYLEKVGPQMGDCYFFTNLVLAGGPDWGRNLKAPRIPMIVDRGISWGELCFGGLLGLSLSKTLLKGPVRTPSWTEKLAASATETEASIGLSASKAIANAKRKYMTSRPVDQPD